MNDKQVTITFSIPALDIVLAGVRKLPIEHGLDILNHIVNTANEQLAAKQEEEPSAS